MQISVPIPFGLPFLGWLARQTGLAPHFDSCHPFALTDVAPTIGHTTRRFSFGHDNFCLISLDRYDGGEY
ncbi:hypothetical protein M406DRAFT_102572 [Cryphonectria parasitica EP155]|uniref:Uncharacterized protein n=1 Tax=Cryphonectria parasitica (strain ATCC 38755 / EP155) TaxID=660469 RepID=A0A9P5CMT0_CRYP1|nr:uncharacterized protein M406DRAFT_102572 [Cryphonectria parasitica EP155]KAF3764448.1 hypothetical protein M406DRAFT_102572 [Cryphonectria parasitica EP155]